jgi:biopolymer transport protein TolR
MAMATGGGGASGPQMNVTPLIDVLLVLIIIFMVIVAEQKPNYKGLDAQIPPPASDTTPSPERTVVIQLAEQANEEKPLLKINQQTVAWTDLRGRLPGIFQTRAEKIAFVQGEDGVDFEYVADVIDTAREAGVQRVGLMPREMAAVH